MMTHRIIIRDFRDVGPACKGRYGNDRIKAIIKLAEEVPMDGYTVIPEVVASSDDPYEVALVLLIYGCAVIQSGMD